MTELKNEAKLLMGPIVRKYGDAACDAVVSLAAYRYAAIVRDRIKVSCMGSGLCSGFLFLCGIPWYIAVLLFGAIGLGTFFFTAWGPNETDRTRKDILKGCAEHSLNTLRTLKYDPEAVLVAVRVVADSSYGEWPPLNRRYKVQVCSEMERQILKQLNRSAEEAVL